MAFRLVLEAINNRNLRGSAKLVAILLADYANEKGMAWPSVETLAKKSGLSTRQIQRVLPQIEGAGLMIKIRTGGGRKCTHQYKFLHLGNPDNLSSFPRRNGDNLSKKGDMVSPDPLITKEKKKIFPGGIQKPRKIKVAL